MSAVVVLTNKISSYEHHQEVIGATDAATVTAENGPVIAIELVNYGTAQAWFHTGSHSGAATAADRVLLVGERLIVPIAASQVFLFSTAGTSVEVNFLR